MGGFELPNGPRFYGRFYDFNLIPILPPCPDGFERKDDGRISIFKQPFGSEGTIENSPAFSMPGQVGKIPSPAGTAERTRLRQGCDAANVFSGVPAGLVVIPSNPGVQTPGYFSRRGGIPLGHSVSVVQKLRCARAETESQFSIATRLKNIRIILSAPKAFGEKTKIHENI